MAKKKEHRKIIPNVEKYDSVVILENPIKILDDDEKPISIYGFLYNKGKKHEDDLWQWELNRYIAYVLASEKVQQNDAKLAPEMWILSNGNSIYLKTGHKNLIYRLMKDKLPEYRIKEYLEPFADIKDGETEGEFVISESFIERYGYEIISFDTIMNERKI